MALFDVAVVREDGVVFLGCTFFERDSTFALAVD